MPRGYSPRVAGGGQEDGEHKNHILPYVVAGKTLVVTPSPKPTRVLGQGSDCGGLSGCFTFKEGVVLLSSESLKCNSSLGTYKEGAKKHLLVWLQSPEI